VSSPSAQSSDLSPILCPHPCFSGYADRGGDIVVTLGKEKVD
jgi:hypothetical protein